jgi:hypothetical protein
VPAVQKVREAANRMLCAAHLRNLGIAAHHYHNDRSSLLPGYLGPALQTNANHPAYFHEGQWIGHLPMLLPYLEPRGSRGTAMSPPGRSMEASKRLHGGVLLVRRVPKRLRDALDYSGFGLGTVSRPRYPDTPRRPFVTDIFSRRTEARKRSGATGIDNAAG